MPEKPFIKKIFSEIATNYDLMNDAMSFGLHRCWKSKLIKQISVSSQSKVLDLAGGTGDIARLLVDKGVKDVTVVDLNPDMINVGQQRDLDGSKADYIRYIKWIEGAAENLHTIFPEETFTHCTMSFGIRNVEAIDTVLRNVAKLLKPGGQFACLEFCPPPAGVIGQAYSFYLDNFIPKIGQIIAKNADSYKYLAESIKDFPATDEFVKMLKNAGFSAVNVQATVPHVANFYICSKLDVAADNEESTSSFTPLGGEEGGIGG